MKNAARRAAAVKESMIRSHMTTCRQSVLVGEVGPPKKSPPSAKSPKGWGDLRQNKKVHHLKCRLFRYMCVRVCVCMCIYEVMYNLLFLSYQMKDISGSVSILSRFLFKPAGRSIASTFSYNSLATIFSRCMRPDFLYRRYFNNMHWVH